MPKYVHLAAHLSSDEMEQQYRQTSDPVERSHAQIIWLLACGKRVREVAEVTGYCANWIRLLTRRYNRGAPSLLSVDQQNRLHHLLEHPSPDGGMWTGPKAARWMSEQLGCKVHPQRGWDFLKKLSFSLQIPRPCHHKADPPTGCATR